MGWEVEGMSAPIPSSHSGGHTFRAAVEGRGAVVKDGWTRNIRARLLQVRTYLRVCICILHVWQMRLTRPSSAISTPRRDTVLGRRHVPREYRAALKGTLCGGLFRRRLSQVDPFIAAPMVTRVQAFSTSGETFVKLCNFRWVHILCARP